MSGIYRGPNGSATADALNIDGDKGDLTISNSGQDWEINPNVVDFSKMQNISTDVLLGRASVGSGDIEEIPCTQAGRDLLDDTDASSQRTTLGLGSVSTLNSINNDNWVGADLSVANGGTGVSTLTGLVKADGTNPFTGAVAGLDYLDPAAIGTTVQAYDANLQGFVNTFTLPTVDATNGFVLQTNGAGTLQLAAPGGIPDGDKGDIAVSSGGTVWTVDTDAITTTKILDDNVTYAKIQNVSATDKLLGRVSSGAGDIEEITCTSAGRALLDDVDVSAQRTTLGLGSLSLQGDGDKGDITVSGAGATWTIDNDAVSFAKMQNITTSRLLGRSTAGSGDVEELSTIPSGVTVPSASIAGALNATGSAPIYACRAWVNFNGTGTVAARASGNVSSITDNGTGDYTINFITAMPDANYSANVSVQSNGTRYPVNSIFTSGQVTPVAPTASSFRITIGDTAASSLDPAYVCCSVIR